MAACGGYGETLQLGGRMTSDRAKKNPPKETTMPAGQWSGEKCPDCGSRLVTDGVLVWCMRRDAETQRCLFVRVR